MIENTNDTYAVVWTNNFDSVVRVFLCEDMPSAKQQLFTMVCDELKEEMVSGLHEIAVRFSDDRTYAHITEPGSDDPFISYYQIIQPKYITKGE